MSQNSISLKLCLDSQTAQTLESQDNAAFDLRDKGATGAGDLPVSENPGPNGACAEYQLVIDARAIRDQGLSKNFSTFWNKYNHFFNADQKAQVRSLMYANEDEEHVNPNYRTPDLSYSADVPLPSGPFPRRFTLDPIHLTQALVESMVGRGASIPITLTGDGGYTLTIYIQYDANADLGFRVDTSQYASFVNPRDSKNNYPIQERGGSYQILDINPPCYINLSSGVIVVQTDGGIRPDELRRLREANLAEIQARFPFETTSTEPNGTFQVGETTVSMVLNRLRLFLTITKNGVTQNVQLYSQIIDPTDRLLVFKLPWGRDVLVNANNEMVLVEARGIWTSTTARAAFERSSRIGRPPEPVLLTDSPPPAYPAEPEPVVEVAAPQQPSSASSAAPVDRPADPASSASVEVILPEGTVLPEGRGKIPCTIRIVDKGRVVILAIELQKPVGSSSYKPNYERATYEGDAKEAIGSSGLSTTGTKMYSRGVTIIWADGEVATYFVEVEGMGGSADFTSKVRARPGAQYNYTPFELGRTGEPKASRPLPEPSRPSVQPELPPASVEVAPSAAPGLEPPSEPASRAAVSGSSPAAEPDPVVPVDSDQASKGHVVDISSQMRRQISEACWAVDSYTTEAGRRFHDNLRLAILDSNLAPILTIWLWSLDSGNRTQRDTATLVPLLDRYIGNDPSVTEQTIIEALQPRLPILRDPEITNLLAETLAMHPTVLNAKLRGIYLVLGELALSFPEGTMSEPIRQRVIATLGKIRSGLEAYQPGGSHRVISGDADYIRDLIGLSEYESRIDRGGLRSYGQQDGRAIVERILSRPPSELHDSLYTLQKMFETGPYGETTIGKIKALLGRAGHEGGFAGTRTASYYDSGDAQRDVKAWLAEGFSLGRIRRLLSQRYSPGVRAQLSHWLDAEGARLQNSPHHTRFQTQAENFAGQLAAQHGEYNPLALAFRSERRRSALALDLHRQTGALELTSPALAQAEAHKIYNAHIESVSGTMMKSGHAVMPGFVLGHAAVSALRGQGSFGENAVMGGFGAAGFSLVDKIMQTAVSVFTKAEKLNFRQLALSAGLAAFVVNTGMAIHGMSEEQSANMTFGDWAKFVGGQLGSAIVVDGFAFLGISHLTGQGSSALFSKLLAHRGWGGLAPYLVPFAGGMTGMEVASLSTHGLRSLGEKASGFFHEPTHSIRESRTPERPYDQMGSLNPMVF